MRLLLQQRQAFYSLLETMVVFSWLHNYLSQRTACFKGMRRRESASAKPDALTLRGAMGPALRSKRGGIVSRTRERKGQAQILALQKVDFLVVSFRLAG